MASSASKLDIDKPRSIWFYYTIRSIVLQFVRLWYGLRIYGTANVPKEGGVLLVCNHITALDPPVVGITFPRVISFMAKKELFESRIVGFVLHHLHAFPVDRSGNASGAVKESIRRLKAGAALVIFVQGTRTAEEGQAFDGASFIAQRANVPLIPAAIWREGRSFHIRYGEVFEPEGKSREAMKALTHDIMHKVNNLMPIDHRMQLDEVKQIRE